MSDSVAARLGEDMLWEALNRLRVDFGISGKSLATLMSDSVAARLGDDMFWEAFESIAR